MKSFKGPRHQGGWIGVAIAAAGAAYQGYKGNKAKEEDRKNADELSELGFQRQAWLDQQSRKWALEDRRYKEDAIAGFRGFAPESANTFNGTPFQTPAPTTTTGLADWNPNEEGAIDFGGPILGMQRGGRYG